MRLEPRRSIYLRRERKEILSCCMIASKRNKFGGNKSPSNASLKIYPENNLKLNTSLRNYSTVIPNSSRKFSIILPVSSEVVTSQLQNYFFDKSWRLLVETSTIFHKITMTFWSETCLFWTTSKNSTSFNIITALIFVHPFTQLPFLTIHNFSGNYYKFSQISSMLKTASPEDPSTMLLFPWTLKTSAFWWRVEPTWRIMTSRRWHRWCYHASRECFITLSIFWRK